MADAIRAQIKRATVEAHRAVVSLDGRRLGTTPLAEQTVWEGRHVVTLVNPDLGVERHVPVDVQAGATAQVRVKLTDK